MNKIFLHVGCGRSRRDRTTQGFAGPNWTELRLDIDARMEPDILGSITAMPAVATGSMDAVFSSHNLEHLNAHEVPVALREFHRVLRPEGFLVLTCPDIQAVAAAMARGALTEPLYISPMGPVAPLDILFGHRGAIKQGFSDMAHRTAFNQNLLAAELRRAGFLTVLTAARPHRFDLWGLASPAEASAETLGQLAFDHLPADVTRGILADAGYDRVPPITPSLPPGAASGVVLDDQNLEATKKTA